MVSMIKFCSIGIDCQVKEMQSHMKVNKYLFVTDREDMFIISRIKMVNFRQSQICSTKVKKVPKGLISKLKRYWKMSKFIEVNKYVLLNLKG